MMNPEADQFLARFVFHQFFASGADEFISPRDLNRIREHASDHWHLENATILGAGPQPIKVDLWRGRLADISGWTFGNIG